MPPNLIVTPQCAARSVNLFAATVSGPGCIEGEVARWSVAVLAAVNFVELEGGTCGAVAGIRLNLKIRWHYSGSYARIPELQKSYARVECRCDL